MTAQHRYQTCPAVPAEGEVAVRRHALMRWPCLPLTTAPGSRHVAYGGEVIEVDVDGFARAVRTGEGP